MWGGRRTGGRRTLIAVAAAAALSASCYSTQEMKVHLDVWPHTPTNCFGAADQVFFDAGFSRIYTAAGANLLYTPRVSALGTHSLGWGIAVWVKASGPLAETCAYDLEAVSIDPQSAAGMWFFSVQRGAEYDQAARDMARRLAASFD